MGRFLPTWWGQRIDRNMRNGGRCSEGRSRGVFGGDQFCRFYHVVSDRWSDHSASDRAVRFLQRLWRALAVTAGSASKAIAADGVGEPGGRNFFAGGEGHTGNAARRNRRAVPIGDRYRGCHRRAASAPSRHRNGRDVRPAPSSRFAQYLLEAVGNRSQPRPVVPFTNRAAAVPKQDGAKFTLLLRSGSVIQVGRPERIAPFILTEAARVAAFFLTSALVRPAATSRRWPESLVRQPPAAATFRHRWIGARVQK